MHRTSSECCADRWLHKGNSRRRLSHLSALGSNGAWTDSYYSCQCHFQNAVFTRTNSTLNTGKVHKIGSPLNVYLTAREWANDTMISLDRYEDYSQDTPHLTHETISKVFTTFNFTLLRAATLHAYVVR